MWAWCLGGFSPAACLSHNLPEPFPTSPSGSPWGEGEVGNGGGRPPKVVSAGRRDNRLDRRAHSSHTPGSGNVWPLCGKYDAVTLR